MRVLDTPGEIHLAPPGDPVFQVVENGDGSDDLEMVPAKPSGAIFRRPTRYPATGGRRRRR